MGSTIDYHPQSPRPESHRILELRIMAGFLAAGATLWAILCAIFILSGSMRALVVFGPGYLVTLGYYWRALGKPSPKACLAIWFLSLVVQGAWLSWVVVSVLRSPMADGSSILFGDLSSFILIVWWGGATIASLMGLFLEPNEPAAAP